MLGDRYGLSPVMVGRQGPLGRLRELTGLDDFQLALVSGEAGIGKTRLIRELGASCHGTVVAGSADPLAMASPLALVADVVGSSPASVGDAVTAVLDLVGRGPAVVVFDDLHWADTDSVEVFERLAQLRPSSVLLIGTYRTEELSQRVPAGGMLARLERRHDVAKIRLDRLDRHDVRAFLSQVHGRPVHSAVADAMYERTGGNPFFLEELVGCCDDLSRPRPDAPLPWSLEEVVRRNLDGLDAAQRRLAEAAAILGVSRFDVLAAVTELEEAELVRQLRGLVDQGLLHEPREDVFVFRHALVRDAVEQHLLGRERRRLHERALTAIAATQHPSWTDLARHAAGAGRHEEMVDHVRAGAIHELRHHGSSHTVLRYAAEALAEAPDDPDLLEVSIEAAWLIGLSDEGLETARKLLDLGQRSGDLGVQATARRWVTRLLHDLGRSEESLESAAELEALLERPLDRLTRLRTLAAIAQGRMLRGDHPGAMHWADVCLAEIDLDGDDGAAIDVAAQAMVERASASCPYEGPDALYAAVDFAERRELWVLVTRGLNNLFDAVGVHTAAGRAALERFHAAAERAGFVAMTSFVGAIRGLELEIGLGDWHAAQTALGRLRDWSSDSHRDRALVDVFADQLALEIGLPIPERSPVDAGPAVPDSEVPHLELRRAAAEGRLTDLERLVAVTEARSAGHHDTLWFPDTALALVEAGVDAERVRQIFLGAAEGRRFSVELLDTIANLADPGRFVADATELLEHPEAEQLNAPTAGGLWIRVAEALVVLGRVDEARVAGERAAVLLASWAGERCDRLARFRAELDRTALGQPGGGATGPRPVAAAGELTPREREVAALVSEGLTNGQLAERLYISRKTASVHVSNILAKLRMSTRSEIAAWWVREQANGS
ncbi:MAG: LuxR C-terminal-related transcriptional regulator [Ilumatobacteraceae bacterium]